MSDYSPHMTGNVERVRRGSLVLWRTRNQKLILEQISGKLANKFAYVLRSLGHYYALIGSYTIHLIFNCCTN
jgi:hypothetical protein